MAHGIIPPFSNHLICEDFLLKTPLGIPVEKDMVLLGEASNDVKVSQEVAEGFQALLLRAYSLYLSAGYMQLQKIGQKPSLESNLVFATLLGAALDIDDANEIIGVLLPNMREGSQSAWHALVLGALKRRIQSVENEIGLLIKEGAKDVYTHAPENGGMEKLERTLFACE